MPLTAPQIEAKLNAGEVIPQIGQIADEHVRALNKMVRAGQIAKWRGKWFPIAGAPFGIGPDKTCYGSHDAKARVSMLVGGQFMTLSPAQYANQARKGYAFRLAQLAKARSHRGSFADRIVYSGHSNSHVTFGRYNYQVAILAAWGARAELRQLQAVDRPVALQMAAE